MKAGGKPKNLKQDNTKAVLDLFRRGGDLSVSEISSSIRLSKTTVKKLIDSLDSIGLVESAGKGDSTDEGGKKPELYRFNAARGYTVVVHVTPDSMIGVITDLKAEITYIERCPLARPLPAAKCIELVVEAVSRLRGRMADTGQAFLGLAVVLPGLVDSSRGVSIYTPHYPEWGRDLPFVELLAARLGPSFEGPIHVDNANRYQAVAESEKGVADGCKNFIVIDALSEGLGAGIHIHGRIIQGSQSISGEVGHMTLDPNDGFPCICGHKGCFEAMVSGRRILGMAREAEGRFPESILFKRTRAGTELRLDDVCEGAALGDPLCLLLVDDAARWFIVGLGNIIMVNDPELIVLQGAYVKAGEHFIQTLRDGIRHIGLPDVEKLVKIEYSTLGEERGVLGGAVFMIADHFANRVVF
jgi:predicted NBD/HSP70 family sugar kinase